MPNEAAARERLTKEEVMALMDEHFPQVHEGNGRVSLEFLAPMTAHVRMAHDPRSIRPGGTVSGPAMFKLADVSVYATILGELGAQALQAVTTSLTMNFLTRPLPGDMIAKARLLKLGRRLAVAEAEIYSADKPEMVAHATATYALPPEESGKP